MKSVHSAQICRKHTQMRNERLIGTMCVSNGMKVLLGGGMRANNEHWIGFLPVLIRINVEYFVFLCSFLVALRRISILVPEPISRILRNR